jgi:hypothetical protein
MSSAPANEISEVSQVNDFTAMVIKRGIYGYKKYEAAEPLALDANCQCQVGLQHG